MIGALLGFIADTFRALARVLERLASEAPVSLRGIPARWDDEEGKG